MYRRNLETARMSLYECNTKVKTSPFVEEINVEQLLQYRQIKFLIQILGYLISPVYIKIKNL